MRKSPFRARPVEVGVEMKTDKKTLELMKALSDAKAPSGFEDETVTAARQYLGDTFRLEEDSLRNLYIYRKHSGGNKPVLMLDAHSDEVGFMVHSIKPNGTLRFVELGGWSQGTLPGTKVLVKNADGEWLPGTIAAKPPHFLTPEERKLNQVQPVQQLVIDVGATSDEEAKREFHIRIGEPAVPAVRFEYDERRDIMHGKGFDCRIGCTALIRTMQEIADAELEVDVVGVLSSQEEVGERGCKVAVNRVKPDIAICYEGCPADDTFGEPYAMQTKLKHGPMLRFMDNSVICNPRFQRYVLSLAENLNLPAQASVREGGSNNAAVIQSLQLGAPSIVLGIPVRYIHSPNCIASYFDLDAAVRMAAAAIKSLTADIIRSF